MLSTNKLIGIALASTSVVGAGVGGFYALKPSSSVPPKSKIKDLITNSSRTILESSANTWDIKLSVYATSVKALNRITLTNETDGGVKAWCQGIIDKEIEISKKDEENSDYQIALKLCTKPTNREKLTKNSRTVTSDWEGKATTYKSEGENGNTIPTISNKATATANQIRGWCNGILDNEIEGTENTYNLIVKWCAN